MIEIQTASKSWKRSWTACVPKSTPLPKDAVAPSGGNAGSMPSEDESGNYYNLYLAHKKFNDVLKVTEEVMALYSQYYVAPRHLPQNHSSGAVSERKDQKPGDGKIGSFELFPQPVCFSRNL